MRQVTCKIATEKTEAWIFFDDDNIYVSARCYESHPERRVANEMRRDTTQLRQNDTFLVMFDTYHDRRNGYLFYANAIGGLSDSQVTDEGPPNNDWNTVWEVKTATFDGGWTIEMAIPFKSLRYKPGSDQTWGINLRRVVRWKNEWSYLAQVPRALTTFLGVLKISSAGTLEGLQVPSGSRNLEFKPYALAGVATDRTVTPILSNDQTGRIGGDLKYGITQNLTADLTINTDFRSIGSIWCRARSPRRSRGRGRLIHSRRGCSSAASRNTTPRRRRLAATSGSGGSTGPAASCSSFTPMTTTRIRCRTSCRFATAASS